MDPDLRDANLPIRKPACDACRKRKVRCDKLSPCSSCRASNIPCRTTHQTLGRRPRRQVKDRQEQSIGDLQSMVEQLTKALHHHRSDATNELSPGNTASPAVSEQHSLPSSHQDLTADAESSFAGDSSFLSHSKQATQAFEASLASTPQIRVDQGLSNAVASLQEALESSNAQPVSSAHSTEPIHDDESHGLSDLPLPPTQVVLKLLKRAKVEPRRMFESFPALDTTTMISYCQRVFFATEAYSVGTFIIVNASLILMMRGLDERAKRDIQIPQPDLAQYLDFLPKNVDVAVRKLPLVAAYSMEKITALLLACSLAVESSIQASAWDLIATAARMALSAGLHRLGNKPGDAEQRYKRVTFWLIYAMDRSLALSLGRAPNIQDYDIQTGRLSVPGDMDSPEGHYLACWIDAGELQGQTYYQLYSAHAQIQAPEAKAAAAKQLATRCLEIQKNYQSLGDVLTLEQSPSLKENDFLQQETQEIGWQSLLTMIYRMIPPDDSTHPLQFCEECILSARTALNLHNRACSRISGPGDVGNDDLRVFVHWSTLFSPFVPFICIFGNVIAQSNLQDLALLGEFVSTLRCAADQSRTLKKLHDACSSFHQIAKAFVARRSQQAAPSEAGGETTLADWQPLDGLGELGLQPLSDTSLSQQDWDFMLRDWDLGLARSDARQMSSFLDLLPTA